MARNIALPDDPKAALVSAVFKGLENGAPVGPLLEMMQVSRTTWWEWMHSRPDWAETYARAQETWAEKLVHECPAVARDASLDPKTRRVIIDANLKVAALLAPRRFSQAALDRIVAPPENESTRTPAELAQAIMQSLSFARRLEEPEDAEFDEVEGD